MKRYAGLWTGALAGAFIGILATRNKTAVSDASPLQPRPLAIDPLVSDSHLCDVGIVGVGEVFHANFAAWAFGPASVRNDSTGCSASRLWITVDGRRSDFPPGTAVSLLKGSSVAIDAQARLEREVEAEIAIDLLVIRDTLAWKHKFVVRARSVLVIAISNPPDASLLTTGASLPEVLAIDSLDGTPIVAWLTDRSRLRKFPALALDETLGRWVALDPTCGGGEFRRDSWIVNVVRTDGRQFRFEWP